MPEPHTRDEVIQMLLRSRRLMQETSPEVADPMVFMSPCLLSTLTRRMIQPGDIVRVFGLRVRAVDFIEEDGSSA